MDTQAEAKPKALVVDDERHRHDLLGWQLESHYDVHHAYGAQEALEAMKTNRYAHVSLDHDLGVDPATGATNPTGKDLSAAMAGLPADHKPPSVRIHSWNHGGAIAMKKDLEAAGYPAVVYSPADA